MNKAWIYVAMTSFFELVWIFGFNVASSWWHWVFIVFFIFVDFYYLTKACELLPTGSVYATFAGIGTIGTALMDIFFFGQSLNLGKIFFIIVLVAGVIGLNIADVQDKKKQRKEARKNGLDIRLFGSSQ
ncbi:DMT family transporter [Mesobacillus zeae]|uniref:DMT family transporter n=1 Tax=Mesobacillus zeae TaxID=1917180 RepID=UPI0026C3C3D6